MAINKTIWINALLNPDTFTQGLADAESLMRYKQHDCGAKAEGMDMPFLEYFHAHCKNTGSCLDHIINTLALADHFLFYFSDRERIFNLHRLTGQGSKGIDEETAGKLAYKPGNQPNERFWVITLLLAALLHDLGKTLTHERDPFNTFQHANKGYLLYNETMCLREDLKNIGAYQKPARERQEFIDFLNGIGFSSSREIAQIHNALQLLILFHDRIGVWLTGESGVKPVFETLKALREFAGAFELEYIRLTFTFFIITLADIMASTLPPKNAQSNLAFTNKNGPHPLKKVKPGDQDSIGMLEDFMALGKGAKVIELLNPLLEFNLAAFQAEAAVDRRFYRMIIGAGSESADWNNIYDGIDKTEGEGSADARILKAIRDSNEVQQRHDEILQVFDGLGVWDYSLGTFGVPFYKDQTMLNIMDRTPVTEAPLGDVVKTWVKNRATAFIGYYKFRVPNSPIINLEFKNHENPLLYISPIPEPIPETAE